MAWAASVAVLPIYFFVMVGVGMSPSGPHASAGELLLLATGPIVAAIALLRVISRGKITGGKSLAIIIPAILSSAELAYTFYLLMAG